MHFRQESDKSEKEVLQNLGETQIPYSPIHNKLNIITVVQIRKNSALYNRYYV